MDALIERHGLGAVQRHRAMGDVAAMLSFFLHARSAWLSAMSLLAGQSASFDLDSCRLLMKALSGQDGKDRTVIELPAIGEPDVLMP